MNGNRQQQNGRRGVFVPQKYAEEQRVSDRSLQINIDSTDDAKSVIQNLQAVKDAYEAAGVTSVEFCIAESIARQAEDILIGAIPWCRTYIKHLAPQPGNVLFPLPSYRDLSAAPIQTLAYSPERPSPVSGATPAHVKPQRPVRADPAAT